MVEWLIVFPGLQDYVVYEPDGRPSAVAQVFPLVGLLDGQHLDGAAEDRTLFRIYGLDFLHGVRVRERDVVHLKQRPLLGAQGPLLPEDGLDDGVGATEQLPPRSVAALRVRRARGFQGAVEHRGHGPPPPTEVDVPGAEGEAVGGVPLGGDDDDAGVEEEVGDHAADDDGLLDVLLAEVGGVGLDGAEELHADGGDAAEEGGAAGALEDGADGADGDEAAVAGRLLRGRHARGVHLGGRGVEDGADAAEVGPVAGQFAVQLGELAHVGVPGGRVGRQVLAGAELRRVDEEGDDDVVGAPGRGADQREVAGVQGAHGRHQRDEALGVAQRPPPRAQGFDGAQVLDRGVG